jgi:hypothetical protein
MGDLHVKVGKQFFRSLRSLFVLTRALSRAHFFNDEILADTNRISIPGTVHSDTSAIVDTDIISEIARLNFLIIRI